MPPLFCFHFIISSFFHFILSSFLSFFQGIVHMDLKSPNILLTSVGTAKLADVGVSRLREGTFLSDLPLVGTFAW